MSWTLIEQQTLSSAVSTVTIGSGGTIPQTYKSLRLVVSARSTQASNWTWFRISFNGSGGTAYSIRGLYADGSTVSTYSETGKAYSLTPMNSTGANATASTFGNTEIIVPTYTGSTNKVFAVSGVGENNATSSGLGFGAALWANTAAITSITIDPDAAVNWVSGSTFTLYGLA